LFTLTHGTEIGIPAPNEAYLAGFYPSPAYFYLVFKFLPDFKDLREFILNNIKFLIF